MIATLQSLRFIFMMMIFMSHFAYRDIRAFDAGGDCGVAFFFMLSGFVCTLGYGHRLREGIFNYGGFIWKRFRKLYPLHLLCLLFYLVVSHSPLDLKVLLNILLLQSWVPDADWYFSCNSVSWFLSSLLFCYLVFPWAYRHLSKYLTLAIFIAYAVLLVTLFVYPFTDAKLRNAPLYWLVLIPLILFFAQEKGIVSRLLKTKSMLFLGSLTMPLFLTHQMLIGILLRRLPEMPSLLMLTCCVFITLTISWCIQTIFSRCLRL